MAVPNPAGTAGTPSTTALLDQTTTGTGNMVFSTSPTFPQACWTGGGSATKYMQPCTVVAEHHRPEVTYGDVLAIALGVAIIVVALWEVIKKHAR